MFTRCRIIKIQIPLNNEGEAIFQHYWGKYSVNQLIITQHSYLGVRLVGICSKPNLQALNPEIKLLFARPNFYANLNPACRRSYDQPICEMIGVSSPINSKLTATGFVDAGISECQVQPLWLKIFIILHKIRRQSVKFLVYLRMTLLCSRWCDWQCGGKRQALNKRLN